MASFTTHECRDCGRTIEWERESGPWPGGNEGCAACWKAKVQASKAQANAVAKRLARVFGGY